MKTKAILALYDAAAQLVRAVAALPQSSLDNT
jgi:hypothetical protein